MNELVDIARRGHLPRAYQEAQRALEQCAQMDECQKWKDKAAALASYAKQAGDETLHRYADRIKARAVRRCGELAKRIEPKNGARSDLRPAPTRGQAARDAGLSPRQLKTALRVANVAKEDFERQVESEKPPTVTALAEQGKRPSMRGAASIEQFRAASRALGKLRDFAEFTKVTDPAETAQGVQPAERVAVRRQVAAVDAWLDRFVISLNVGE